MHCINSIQVVVIYVFVLHKKDFVNKFMYYYMSKMNFLSVEQYEYYAFNFHCLSSEFCLQYFDAVG